MDQVVSRNPWRYFGGAVVGGKGDEAVGHDVMNTGIDSSAVLNRTANDNQANFPFHHFFVDTSNYTGLGEATAAFGLARLLQATGRSAHLPSARFLNWEAARQEQLVILGAPHESAFVQSTLSVANFTIGYDSIQNAQPIRGEQPSYSKSRRGDVLEDYGLIWMTKSPSGTRILVLAGLSSAGHGGSRRVLQRSRTDAADLHTTARWIQDG